MKNIIRHFVFVLLLFLLRVDVEAQYCTTNLHGNSCTSGSIDFAQVRIINSGFNFNPSSFICNQFFTGGYPYRSYAAGSTYSDTLERGRNYVLALTSNNPGASIAAWMDMNGDGVFSANESVINYDLYSFVKQAGTLIGTFTISPQVLAGKIRLRIRSYQLGIGLTDACKKLTGGVTFDFEFALRAQSVCNMAGTIGCYANQQNFVLNEHFGVYVQGANLSKFSSYHWENSVDSVSWSSVAGANQAAYTGAFFQNMYYRCKVKCMNDSMYTNVVSLRLSIPAQKALNWGNLQANKCASGMDVYTKNIRVHGTKFSVGSETVTPSNCYTYTGTNQYLHLRYGFADTVYTGQSLLLQVIPKRTGSIHAWVDLNGDSVFDVSEYFPVSNNSVPDQKYEIPITLPSQLNNGGYILVRVRNGNTAYGASSANQPVSVGETFDVAFRFLPSVQCTLKTLPVILSTKPNMITWQPYLLYLDSTGNYLMPSYQWQRSSDTIVWTPIPNANKMYLIDSSFNDVYYRCLLTCGSDSLYSNVFLMRNVFLSSYCEPAVNNYPGTFISSILFAGVSNLTALPVLYFNWIIPNYLNYQTLYTPTYNCKTNTTYPVYISQSSPNGFFKTTTVFTFIDFDHSGSFEASEKVLTTRSDSTIFTSHTQKGNIVIPVTAYKGITRIRFIMMEGNQNTVDPCTNANNISIFDGLINIGTDSCTQAAIPLSWSKKTVCRGERFNLKLYDQFFKSDMSFEWQHSPDSITWTGMNVFSPHLDTVQTTPTFYRCKITCGAGVNYSDAVLISLDTVFYHCYCNWFIDPTNLDIKQLTFANDVTNYSPPSKPIILTRGGSTFASIGNFSKWNYQNLKFSLYIDLDQNGNYDTLNERFFYNDVNSVSTVSGHIVIPATVPKGITGMRLVLNENRYLNKGCVQGLAGFIKDTVVSIQDTPRCNLTQNISSTLADDSTVCPGKTVTLTLSSPELLTGLRFQWQKSADSVNWINLPYANENSADVNQNAITFYRCRLTCGPDTVFSVPLKIGIKNFFYCYCTPHAMAGPIYGPDLLTLNNYSRIGFVSPTTSYTDLTNDVMIKVNRNTTEYMQIDIEDFNYTVSNYVQQGFAAYIDYNHNSVFDPEERLFFQDNENYHGTYNFPFTVPANALNGKTRMRIMVKNDMTTGENPCGYYDYVKYEDYTVVIAGNKNLSCDTSFAPGTALSSSDHLCKGTSFQLYLDGDSYQQRVSYQWQRSPDNLNWSDITGDSSAFVSHILDQPAYYRCKVSCGALAKYTNSILVSLSTDFNCYCTTTSSTGSSGRYFTRAQIANLNVSSGFEGYKLFSDVMPAELVKGTTYPLNFNLAGSGIYKILVYIDFNHDAIFDSLNERVYRGFTTASSTTFTATVIIPAGVPDGKTLMRFIITNYLGSADSACTPYTSETEDYSVNFSDNFTCGSSSIPHVSASGRVVCFKDPFTLSLSNFINTSGLLSYTWQRKNAGGWTNLTDTGKSVTLYQKESSWYRCIAGCTGGVTYSDSVFVAYSPAYVCSLPGSNGQPAYLRFVSLGGFVWTQGDTEFFPEAKPIELNQNSYCPIWIIASTSADVYADLNGNGIFESVEFLGNIVSNGALTKASIYIPEYGITGKIRLRISSPYDALHLLAIIHQRYYWEGKPMAGKATSTRNELCEGDQTILQLTGCSDAENISFLWQSSPDGLAWNNMPSGNARTMVCQLASDSMYHRCIVMCGSYGDTSTTLLLKRKNYLQCYCKSYKAGRVNGAAIQSFGIDNIFFNESTDNMATSNNTSAGPPSYSDYTNSFPPVVLERGVQYVSHTYLITDYTGGSSNFYSFYNAYMFIDNDHNGKFDLYSDYSGGHNYSRYDYDYAPQNYGRIIFTINPLAKKGITRMRIALNNATGCGASSGETEDYAINIINPKSDIGISKIISPVPGNFSDCINVKYVPFRFRVQNMSRDTLRLNDSSLTVKAWVTRNGTDTFFRFTLLFNTGLFLPDEEYTVSASDSILVTDTTDYLFNIQLLMAGDMIIQNDTFTLKGRLGGNPVAFNLGNDTFICREKTLLLNNYSYPSGTKFLWSTGAVTKTILADSTQQYWLKITTQSGCISADTINLTIKELPVSLLPLDTNLCAGQQVNIKASDSITFTFLWSNNATSPSLVVNDSGKYAVSITGTNGCGVTDTIHVTLRALPVINLGADKTLCKKDSITQSLSVNFTINNLLWSDGTQNHNNFVYRDTGVYWAKIITKSTGCSATDSVSILPLASPAIDLGNDYYTCSKDSILLTPIVLNVDTFLWNTGAKTSTIKIVPPGLFYLTVKNRYGCKNYDTLKIYEGDVPTVNLGKDTSLCFSDSMLLIAGSDPSYQYLWFDNAITMQHYVQPPGSKFVRVTSPEGCQNRDTVTLRSRKPVSAFTATNTVGKTYQFSALVNANKYYWIFGDGGTDSIKSPLHQYAANGNYHVILKVADSTGCAADSFTTINIQVGLNGYHAEISKVMLYPNPSNGGATLGFTNKENTVVSITVFDINGKQLFQLQNIKLKQGSDEIDLSAPLDHFNNGLYFIKIQSENMQDVLKLSLMR